MPACAGMTAEQANAAPPVLFDGRQGSPVVALQLQPSEKDESARNAEAPTAPCPCVQA